MSGWILERHINAPDSLLIGFTGDVMIGRLVNEYLTGKDPKYLWGDVLPLLQSTDLNIINLEAALTCSDKKVAKVFNFKADPEKVQTLLEGNIQVVNLANNHILDYSEEGLLETLKTLSKVDIKYVGAGRDIFEASRAITIEKKGIKIGILGFTDNEPTWKAGVSTPGTNFVEINDNGLQHVKKKIEELRENVDLIIVSMHWGPNMRERPNQQFVKFAHGVMDSGADVFHGHSAHIFQGIELYQGKLIMYDTGDFVDDYYVDPHLRNDHSFLYIVELNKDGFQNLRLEPVLIDNFQVNICPNEEILERARKLSKEFNTELYIDDHGLVS